MTVFDIADYSTPFIEATGLFLLFATFMKSRVKLSVWMVGVGIFSLGSLITICNYYFLYQYPNNFFNKPTSIFCAIIAPATAPNATKKYYNFSNF